jgi:hypothetical protein
MRLSPRTDPSAPSASSPYGAVAVFRDLYGNLWDLLQLRKPALAAGYAAWA